MLRDTPPLAVDLDGTLLKTDTLHELILRLVKREPWQLFCLPWVLLRCFSRGKQYLKQYLVEKVSLDPVLLPYNPQLLEFLKQQHQQGRVLVLATGCHATLATVIADHLGIFQTVLATDEKQNLTGAHKAEALSALYGKGGFDYAGNAAIDKSVWHVSREKILVNASSRLTASLQSELRFSHIFDRNSISLTSFIKGLRIYQWAKNALLFLPALTSQTLLQGDTISLLLIAFLAFGCCASFSYVINDLLDLDDDRKHHRKKNRPFASGKISIPTALVMAVFLLAGAILLAAQLNWRFAQLLLLYFVVTNLYSFWLKRIPIVDVSILAGLYTLRVLAGAIAIEISASFWLIGFSAFLFFSLAIVKRLSELLHLKKQGADNIKARGYIAEDVSTLQGLGTAAAMASVLVLSLYINSDSVRSLYNSPNHLWLLCPVMLLWLGRVWLITGRGNMHDDPVVFALKDRTSWLILLIGAVILLSATYF